MKKLEMHSESLINENIAKLAELFPECVTEVVNENNELEKQVDFDVFRSLFKNTIITENKERYQFTWPGKQVARAEAFIPTDKSLRPCKKESVNFDTTENLYIEGDNLTVLKLLRHTYHGKIKMIYIDPPYNTGNDFVYNDNFKQKKAEYNQTSGEYDELGNRLYTNTVGGGYFHTNWLNMMYPRLLLARDLLSKDGVLFISIDDTELNRLVLLCSEIFGQENILALFPRITKKAGKSTEYIAQNHDYIVAIEKTKKVKLILPNHIDDGFKFSDEFVDSRGLYKLNQTLDYDSLQYSESLDYPITINGEKFYPGGSYEKYLERKNGKHARADWAWRWSKELFEFGLENGFIVVKQYEGHSRIYTKTYQKCNIEKNGKSFKIIYEDRTRPISSLEFIDNKFSNDNSKKNILQVFNTSVFDYSKPILLLQTLIQYSTNSEDYIMDFFSGSATTAHAVMKLNAEDGGHRKFIMVQVPEFCDDKSEAYKAGYKNICEIGKERIRRAGQQILDELSAKNEGSLFENKTELDIGFRVFKQSDAMLSDLSVKPEEADQLIFKQMSSKIKNDRTPEDLLFYSMLELGVPLSEKIEQISIGSHTLFKVENANLIACFEQEIDEEMVTEVAKMNPDYFILREDSIDDSLINNIDSIFKVYSKNADVEDRIRIL